MITLNRVRTIPPVHANFQKAKRERFNLELMKDRRTVLHNSGLKQKFVSSCWRKAKPQLLKESRGKCAYCETPTSVVAFGDVEHYRPKSKYWWLAYCYDNYLASCQICNQKYKKARFPLKNSPLKSPVTVKRNSTDAFLEAHKSELSPDALNSSQVARFKAFHQTERPFIVNPYMDNPAQWFAWDAIDKLQRVKLVPLTGVSGAQNFVTAAEQDLGLNRIELQELRYAEFEKFRTFKQTLKDPTISVELQTKVKNMIQKMMADNAPYAGMLRFFDPVL